MTPYDKIFVVVILLLFMAMQAGFQKEWFAANKPAGEWWHFWQGVLYGGCVVAVVMPFFACFGWWAAAKLAFIGVLQRLAIYAPMLNKMRRKRLFYNGRGSTASWQNQLENKLPDKWVRVLKIGYIVVFICAVIFIR